VVTDDVLRAARDVIILGDIRTCASQEYETDVLRAARDVIIQGDVRREKHTMPFIFLKGFFFVFHCMPLVTSVSNFSYHDAVSHFPSSTLLHKHLLCVCLSQSNNW
jgi:Tfp pilus assembly ATPase PilU